MPAVSLSRAGARVVESGPGGQELSAGTWQKLEALPDPRSPRGRIYPLACLVAVALCAFSAAGNDRLTAVGQWIKRASQADLARLRAPWDPMAGRYRVPDEISEKNAQYIAVVKRNQPLLHAQVRALPWAQVPAGSRTRETGHGRAETRTLKAAHVSGLDFPHARQAIKITRWRQEIATGRVSHETVYAVTSLTSAKATVADLARLVREQWSIEAHHHVRDLTFREDTAASRTGSGPANLATIRAAVTAALKDAGYLHIPEGRRDHTTPAETLRLHGLD
jgi:predicted transposase YbfD/YdcC